MSSTTWETPAEVKRDRWGRPLITPPDGGKPKAYTRATTLAGTLDDLHGLMSWKQRMTAIGITDRPDLQIAVAAHRDDKKHLDSIVQEAMAAAASSAAATTGTALHALVEQIDRGIPVGKVPEKFQADLDAYVAATADLTAIHIEQMSVIDELEVAGTPDRIVQLGDEFYVADVKTGTIDYPHKIAAQLALYARAVRYDITTGHRSAWISYDSEVNTDRALIIHLPAGEGRCELVWVDIAAGWEAVRLSVQARAWRAAKGLTWPYTPPEIQEELLSVNAEAALEQAIKQAGSVDDLYQLWTAAADRWAPRHTELAAQRKQQLSVA